MTIKYSKILSVIVFSLLASCSKNDNSIADNKGADKLTEFSISFDPSVRDEATSGRVLLLFSNLETVESSTAGEGVYPGVTGVPVYGVNIDELEPGKPVILGEQAYGYPFRHLSEMPAGEYYVQAYLNVYTTFKRADGHVVKLHHDQGEGQNWRRSPGNLFSKPKKIRFDPKSGERISIVMDQKIPPVQPFQETEWVKHVRIQSKLLTEFWGQPMYIGARVLLPRGFHDNPDARYPLISTHGHYPGDRAPGGFVAEAGNTLYDAWIKDDMPRVLLVNYEHATPYYDDSYAVNTENMGPYGDAFTEELIPYIEENFRAIGKPYARLVTGGSTGGWISTASQVWNPDYYGGAWIFCPDQVDFRKYQQANLYEDNNAYYKEYEWVKVERPLMRETDGTINFTMRQFSQYEQAIGDRYRSGGQMAVFNSIFAPVADDGYPKPLWDPETGVIDHEVTDWARENFDIRHYLERNWETVGPKLVGKLHFYCGRMDNFYLNEALYFLEDFLESTTDPHYGGSFTWGVKGSHSWTPWNGERREGKYMAPLLHEMADHMIKNLPDGEDPSGWYKQ